MIEQSKTLIVNLIENGLIKPLISPPPSAPTENYDFQDGANYDFQNLTNYDFN